MAKKNDSATSQMFATFGEFDSAEEINLAAAGLKEEGDLENLVVLAEENGLSLEDVQEYAAGNSEELTDVISAAIGKLMLEKKHENNILIDDIVDYLMSNCDEEKLARGIRKKGKRTTKAVELIAQEARKNTVSISGGESCSYCGPMKGFQIIRDYYTED